MEINKQTVIKDLDEWSLEFMEINKKLQKMYSRFQEVKKGAEQND